MKGYKLYHSQRFDRDLEKFDKRFYDRIDKIEYQPIENPYVGKPLCMR